MNGPTNLAEFEDYLIDIDSEDKEIPSSCHDLILLLKSFADEVLKEQNGSLRFSIIEAELHSFEELEPNIVVDELGRITPEIIAGKAEIRFEFTSECHFKSAIKARIFRMHLERLVKDFKSYDYRGRSGLRSYLCSLGHELYYDVIGEQIRKCNFEEASLPIVFTITDILSQGNRGFDATKSFNLKEKDDHSTTFVSVSIKKKIHWAK